MPSFHYPTQEYLGIRIIICAVLVFSQFYEEGKARRTVFRPDRKLRHKLNFSAVCSPTMLEDLSK